ncbi:MAG: DUF4012 domain-containing protein [Patescibacteria group bacterium]
MSSNHPNFLPCPGASGFAAPASSDVTQTPLPPPVRKVRRWTWILLSILIVGIGVNTPAFVACGRAGFAAHAAWAAIRRAEAHARVFDVFATRDDLRTAATQLATFRSALESVGVWRSVPRIGTQLRALEDAADAMIGTLNGIQHILDMFETIASASSEMDVGISSDRSYATLSKEEKRAVVRAMADALPSMRLARDNIDLALELWNRVSRNELIAPIQAALRPFAETLPTLKRALDEAVPLIEIGIAFAGYPDPARALVVLQNADELRPSGGFIGTIGTVTLDGGDLAEFEFQDVYAIDNPVASTWKDVPPQPLLDRLGVKNWFLRDANWSPDFPSSAERILDVYVREVELGRKMRLSNPPTIVIALEPGFFASLFSITGPITADGVTYDAQNFFDRLEYAVESDFLKKGIPVAHRKDVLAQIGRTMLDRLKSLPVSRWPEVLHLFTTALERKQILLFTRRPDLLAALDRRGWTGRTHPPSGDFLWVIDANMAAFKTDGVMEKRVAYRVDATHPESPIATVTLTYTHTNPQFTWRTTRYRSYTRVYVPEGSVLLDSSGAMKDDRYRTGGVAVRGTVDVTKELGKTVFGTFWSIEPGKTGMLSFTYALPPSAVGKMAHGSYSLDWPKQPGADRTQLTLDLLFDTNVLKATPPESKEKWGDARYEYKTDSLMDRKFNITRE